ncbi:MAG TPA: GTPase, partial [Candidatus Limnocylindria bacterium]|nr:GTPase [Candidatus Limnocylindria bacterium]
MTLAVRLAALDEAVQAAETLGLDAEHASEVAADARRRLSFPGSAYVLALAGGTGVGKSSLLNALAGEVVSRAGARRPTTAEPVAWTPAAARAELAPLLEWLGVTEIREHGDDRARGVAILDLPDLDSIAPEHRARVDELLPRVDAVIWVADPEKYHDAVLQDAYIRTWAPRLARQLFVVNKADRLRAADADGVVADAGRRFREHGIDMPLAVASASDGEAGIAQVRTWIAEGADAKRVVAERIAASARDATLALAERAGVAASDAPLVAPARRELARRDLVRGSLAVLDMRGFARQAVAATRLEA